MSDIKLICGDALEVLKGMESESVDCCITSPPYWGLRDYGTAQWEGGNPTCDHKTAKKRSRYDYSLATSPIQDGERTGTDAPKWKDICPTCGAKKIDNQLGLEKTPEEYTAKIVEVFKEVKRVLKKEGKITVVGDIYDIWDGKTKEIELLDNNIMGLPTHFEKIWGQIKKENLKLRENGLDIRLLDKEKAKILASIKHYDYHFAFDNMQDRIYVEKGIKILKEAGIVKSCFYVLVGFNTTYEEDLDRLNLLRSYKQNAYVQRYHYKNGNLFYIALSRWVNQFHLFQGMTWEQFLDMPEHKSYRGLTA